MQMPLSHLMNEDMVASAVLPCHALSVMHVTKGVPDLGVCRYINEQPANILDTRACMLATKGQHPRHIALPFQGSERVWSARSMTSYLPWM